MIVDDASGLTVSKKCDDYIEEKWIRKKKESLSLHIAVDAKSKKVVSFRITKGNVHDSRKLGPFLREAAEKCDIDKVHADKAHDNRRENFNILDDLNVEPAIGIRKNATSIRARGCQLRKDEVILIRNLGIKDGNSSRMQEKDGLLK
jgi:Transposase DDE domain